MTNLIENLRVCVMRVVDPWTPNSLIQEVLFRAESLQKLEDPVLLNYDSVPSEVWR